MRIKLCAALLGFLLAGSVLPARAQRIRVKLATLAPCGSVWDEALKDLKVRWQQLSNGQVRLTIYCGGTAGDELDVMRRIRIGQLHASFITTQGLESITKVARILTLPRMIRSRSELEHVFEQMGPSLESLLAERGFKVLAWGDGGFVRFFVPKSVTAIGDVRSLKMFTWAGNPETTQLWKDAEFNVMPLPATEVMTGLQTG
ncbi:MAG: TRAP transporter substrate-binding protein DctP, partial [Candidatus Acidiferrales bacterium]